jgi:hypothetical protein
MFADQTRVYHVIKNVFLRITVIELIDVSHTPYSF